MALVVALVVLSLTIFGNAAADDLATCKNGSGEEAFAACTRVLKAGGIDGSERTRVYNARGILWKQKGDYELRHCCGAYENAEPLPNPANDATDITATLRKLGFDVISSNDLRRSAMQAKIREFGRRIENADLSLFYYAGHGLQVAGKNYLLPINANIERESDLNFEAIDVDVVLQQLEGRPDARLSAMLC